METLFKRFIKIACEGAIKLLPPSAALKLLLNFDNDLYGYISRCAIKYDNGIHPKHRLMAYHDYFVKNITDNENVLDIGCGNGALTFDVARKTGGTIIGIDTNRDNIDYAKRHYQRDNLKFIHGDALQTIPDGGGRIDTVIMSNLLEHIEKRMEFLQSVLLKISPQKVLFRVPMYQREWMVPMKQELGVEYRLDNTHCIEYTQEGFFAELQATGLKVDSYEIRWGEIWAKALPSAK